MDEKGKQAIPTAFIWRRVHSLTGLFLLFYLFIHLFTNSQAALFIDGGRGFIHEVNKIHELPYLLLIELLLLALPFLIHIIWGVIYMRSAEYNVSRGDGSRPALGGYPRNWAYTLQRVTASILIIGLAAHVIQMRIIRYPGSEEVSGVHYQIAAFEGDPGIHAVAAGSGVTLYSGEEIADLQARLSAGQSLSPPLKPPPSQSRAASKEVRQALREGRQSQERDFVAALAALDLSKGEVAAVADNFGSITLLMLRDVFKSPWMVLLYTLFLLSAAYHGSNGLWTFAISWGATVSARSQQLFLRFCLFLMGFLILLGSMAILGTYWIAPR